MGRMRHPNAYKDRVGYLYKFEIAAQRIQAALRRMFAIMGLQPHVCNHVDSLIAHIPPIAPTLGWNRLIARVVRYEQLRILWRHTGAVSYWDNHGLFT